MRLDYILNTPARERRFDLMYSRRKIAPWLTCKDGTLLSVQASEYHYCTPRDNQGPWTEVEIMIPGGNVPEYLEGYSEGEPYNDKGDTICAYVPVELVRRYIDEHGGEV